VEQLQSHIWLTASSYMGNYLRISSYIRKPFLIFYDFATAPLRNSLYMRTFFFYQCGVKSYREVNSLQLTTSSLENTKVRPLGWYSVALEAIERKGGCSNHHGLAAVNRNACCKGEKAFFSQLEETFPFRC
jgi:hypothetical protein